MELSINDMAYRGQFDDESAKVVLKSHVDNIKYCSMISGKKIIARTEGLKYRPLTSKMNILDFCFSLGKSKSDRDRTLNRLLLIKFVKGPYIKVSSVSCLLFNSEEITNSALEYCLENSTTRGLVSPNIEDCNGEINLLDNNQNLVASIVNHSNLKDINDCTWRYEPNPKHDIPSDYIVNGNVWSKMNLSDVEAQELLSCGFKIKDRRCVFAFKDEQWYQFYNHEANLFHGFPINNPGNDRYLNQVIKFMDENDCSLLGQTII